MEELNQAWVMLKLGGVIIVPLVALAIIAVAIMLEELLFIGVMRGYLTIC